MPIDSGNLAVKKPIIMSVSDSVAPKALQFILKVENFNFVFFLFKDKLMEAYKP